MLYIISSLRVRLLIICIISSLRVRLLTLVSSLKVKKSIIFAVPILMRLATAQYILMRLATAQ